MRFALAVHARDVKMDIIFIPIILVAPTVVVVTRLFQTVATVLTDIRA